ncbi:homeodomain-interacting protein kinase 4 [Haemorhous mexicanus]|uniref:homeodomain-interacting protein kinase 4 n=1 Tax=Haemorhous mexicanus TaxID=30427 RepID=UPI0028BF48FC|nr:homeodomain-interacting protein kinase 4 [Haemorhous mexicanus]
MVTLVVGAECYDIMAMLGKGTFGQVIQGQCRSTGEMVAIKILKNCDHDGQIVKNELRLLQALREGDTKDFHIIHFLESFSDTVWTYLVFELLQQNLFDFQKQNNFSPLPVRHIRTITAQVLVALVKLKELSIIHADLKPENIMLVDHARYPFRIKLVDFGSAILLPEVCHVQEPYIQTRFYRAPEILLGLPFCEKVDIWSLGCVMAELHLGWPLYPGNDEYDQVCYICSTLGLPRGELLCAAQKTQSFFQRVPCSTGTWQLKPPGKVMAKPMERREHIFSSLDQLAVANVCPMPDPDQEELAKHCDLYRMVELVKRMLTWDSHERITPSAALHHPFISMQEVKASFEATQYYQLSQEDLRASCKDSSIVEIFPGTEKGAFIPASQGGIQKTTAQMDGLSLAEPAGDTGDKCQQDICQAPSLIHCGSQYCQHHWCPEMEPTNGHLAVPWSPSKMKQYSHWYGSPVSGIMEQNLPGRCYSSSCAKGFLLSNYFSGS